MKSPRLPVNDSKFPPEICAVQEVKVLVTVVVTVLTEVTVTGLALLHEVIACVETVVLGGVLVEAGFEAVETEVTVLVTVDGETVIVVVEVQCDSVIAIEFEHVIGEVCTMELVEVVPDCVEDSALFVVDVEELDVIVVVDD